MGPAVVGLARWLAFLALVVAVYLVTGFAMSGSWDRLPFLLGQFVPSVSFLRAPPPRTVRPLLPLMGGDPPRFWTQSPAVLVPLVAAMNAVGGALTRGGVDHLAFGVAVNVVLMTGVCVVAYGLNWRPQPRPAVATPPV